MKNKIKLIGILLLIFLVSLSIASAANDTQTNTTSTITQDTQINTEPTQTINKTQKTLNTKQENTTQKPTVTNKKETNNTVPEKSAAANYKELKSQIYNIAYNGSADVNYTIKLTGTNYRFGTKIFIDRATANLTIIGDSTSKTTITLNGLQSCSLFWIAAGHSLTLINVTCINGTSSDPSYWVFGGGTITNYGTLNLINVSFINNSRYVTNEDGSYGGAIYNTGTMNIYNSTFDGNCAFNSRNSGLDDLEENYAHSHGGAIYNTGTMNVYNTTFNKNSAIAIYTSPPGDTDTFGGAIYNTGIMNLVNINFTGNLIYTTDEGVAYGGAIYTNKSLNLTGIKFVNNSASSYDNPQGGAIYSENSSLNITNSILFNNYIMLSDDKIYNSIYCSNSSYYSFVENNWWGTTAPDWNQTLVNVNAPESWIYLKVTLSKDNINVTENTQIKTDFNWLTNGKNVSAYSNNILDGSNISYDLTKNIVKISPIINTIQNGTSTTIFTGTKSGITNITLKTDNILTNETMFLTVNALPTSTKITYITPNITPGSNMTIQANITDKNKQPITTGEVVIKINGKTLKDEYEQSIKIPVVNGTINYTYYIPDNYSTKQYNLTIKYLRNDKYTPSEQTTNFTITKAPSTTKITYITPNINPGSNMTIQANITDKNKQPITTGEVVIKINGKTLKDEYKQSIKIPVHNGTINYTYHIPENYSAKTYNITVKYLRNDKYTPSEQTTNFTITKNTQTITKIETIPPVIAGSNITIQANITTKDNQPINNGYAILKINGKTLKDTQQNNIEVSVINGKINYNYTIPNNYSPKTYNLTVKYTKTTQYTSSEQTTNFTIIKTQKNTNTTQSSVKN